MTDVEKIKAIQELIGVAPDGMFGSQSKAALETLIHPKAQGELKGDGTWPLIHARIDGDDILISDAVVTAFGGTSDSMDSGETASGYSTKDHPDVLGCALPMRRDASSALRGSPIPKLPWFTEVIFIDPIERTQVRTKLIDEGPNKRVGHAGDLSVAAARMFDPKATANNFTKTLNIRILGGAKYA